MFHPIYRPFELIFSCKVVLLEIDSLGTFYMLNVVKMFEILGYRCECLMLNTHNKWRLKDFRKTCCLSDVVVSHRNPDILMGMPQFYILSAISFCHNTLKFLPRIMFMK